MLGSAAEDAAGKTRKVSRGSLSPAVPSEALAVTGALTQIFEEGQRQDDPDGHKYHQVVPVQVPFAAGEFGRGQSRLFHRASAEFSVGAHPELSSKDRKARMTSGSSYLTMKR